MKRASTKSPAPQAMRPVSPLASSQAATSARARVVTVIWFGVSAVRARGRKIKRASRWS